MYRKLRCWKNFNSKRSILFFYLFIWSFFCIRKYYIQTSRRQNADVTIFLPTISCLVVSTAKKHGTRPWSESQAPVQYSVQRQCIYIIYENGKVSLDSTHRQRDAVWFIVTRQKHEGTKVCSNGRVTSVTKLLINAILSLPPCSHDWSTRYVVRDFKIQIPSPKNIERRN